MTPRSIIEKKRDGRTLTADEIEHFIRGCTSGDITDYHASAFLMAVFMRGMNHQETVALTRAMRDSGETLKLSAIPAKKLDKHSTGGVGDKTSLIVAPAAAACGLVVPMITGRALGHTGGTLDKLQAIPGFDPYLTPERAASLLARHGAVMMGQTSTLASADRRLYALRDATGTIESIPLITASILSKKLAEDIDGLVLDVKTGSGAFMPTKALAFRLARSLVKTCRAMNVRAAALITDMDQPLGFAIGNALEVKECLDCLHGKGPEDVKTVALALTARMILLAGAARTEREAMRASREALESGAVRRRFLEIVEGQGGDVRTIENPNLLPQSAHITPVKAARSGIVMRADARLLGMAAGVLGAGRIKVEDPIDPAVGLYLRKKTGDRVRLGDILCDVHWNDEKRFLEALPLIQRAFRIGARRSARRPLIHGVVEG